MHPHPTIDELTPACAWGILLGMAQGETGIPLVDPNSTALQVANGASDAVRQFAEIYLPFLVPPPADRPRVLAHLAQSLDGRIALPNGESQWISGDADLEHTHRLRALSDAVLVGALTVERDDPQLTTRRARGPSPLRVIVDPRGRLDGSQRVFHDGGATLVVGPAPDGAESLRLPTHDGVISPHEVLTALGQRGIRRVFIEGGGVTVSRFLHARCVDRLHLVVAPLLVGYGRPALSSPLAETLADCPRPPTRVVPMGQDWLFDCALTEVP